MTNENQKKKRREEKKKKKKKGRDIKRLSEKKQAFQTNTKNEMTRRVYVCTCVYACACVRNRERERVEEKNSERTKIYCP